MNEIAPSKADDRQFNFHLEEFKLLKEEILQQQRIRLQLEIFTISAAGLIASFLMAHKQVIETARAEIGWFAPLLVLYFGLIWSRSHVQRSSEIGSYLARVEARFGLSDLGWERTVAAYKVERGGMCIGVE
jgi:hypothetical protein